ncbi:MAG: M48 family metalloprotease [Bacteroidia bacterium]|nr:M48 family metalloprotease [Bacteroidia bacterium]
MPKIISIKSLSTCIIIVTLLLPGACKKKTTDKCGGTSGGPGGLVSLLVSTTQDKQMGLAAVNQIEADPQHYKLLDSATHVKAYGHLYRIGRNILNSGNVFYKDEFAWRLRIIHDDSTLNAFCTPGGYIYVYTGLIKYLDNETQLAGVMGHEMAHADRRHSASQMVKQYGISALLSVLSDSAGPGALTNLGVNLLFLKYSRENETEADNYSVRYLSGTDYDGRGAKYFFEKLIAKGQQGSTPAFLSTHPSPDDRVANIQKLWECLGSKPGQTFESQYADFKNSLP